MTNNLQMMFKFGTDVWDPTHRFETSWLLSPWALFVVRASISLYTFFVLLFVIFWEIARIPNGTAAARFEFSYFTILCYWGLAFYFAISAVHTFTYARSGTPLLSRFPRPLQALHALYNSTIMCYPPLVTIVYWGRSPALDSSLLADCDSGVLSGIGIYNCRDETSICLFIFGSAGVEKWYGGRVCVWDCGRDLCGFLCGEGSGGVEEMGD
ncbi:hypothetical protein SS1G_06258 [Sclerotinia sclerotiorum 1980 UF-70]|uniref:Uncharacterized protein n=1 Tax=Sclerotinia sclerotiorum (strain ATCC 18683 / 1980 / Ss-1) TaxID=665079 RepID=A7ELR1_SCLS1|nr:hypothetical protein SS1G_06258 [Sclerotinia sclerotiorum 1980 UF-70]EDO03777.1 hypothetical protein SS1G_06258 [Sclerotinia sclerotiorum 1980 UF-70]